MKAGLLAAAGLVSLTVGCSTESDWDLPVIAKAENPRNGYADFTSQCAEVVQDKCGFLRRACVSVRLLDETGWANSNGGRVFSYALSSPNLHVEWADAKRLHIVCTGCDQDRVRLELATINSTQITYLFPIGSTGATQ